MRIRAAAGRPAGDHRHLRPPRAARHRHLRGGAPDPGRDGRALRQGAGRAAGPGWWRGEAAGVARLRLLFAQFRDRSAYRFTAEDSVYVRDDVRGQGVGKALVAALIERPTSRVPADVAVIGDSDNIGSIGLHACLGFQHGRRAEGGRASSSAAGWTWSPCSARWAEATRMSPSPDSAGPLRIRAASPIDKHMAAHGLPR